MACTVCIWVWNLKTSWRCTTRLFCFTHFLVTFSPPPSTAGAFDFNSCRPGPSYHLQHMSITCRHSLADKINQSAMFPQFCRALGVDDDLRRKASRSGNPTAYLLQEYQELPEATFDRLEQALSQMGRKDLFDQVWQLMQNSVHWVWMSLLIMQPLWL